MASRIGVNVVPVKPPRAERQYPWSRRCGVLDHDVEVDLLWHRRVRPGRRSVARDALERQAGRR